MGHGSCLLYLSKHISARLAPVRTDPSPLSIAFCAASIVWRKRLTVCSPAKFSSPSSSVISPRIAASSVAASLAAASYREDTTK